MEEAAELCSSSFIPNKISILRYFSIRWFEILTDPSSRQMNRAQRSVWVEYAQATPLWFFPPKIRDQVAETLYLKELSCSKFPK